MSFSGGVYTLPGPALVTGEVVSATENNQFRNDVATAFNLTFLRNGTSTATANLPMGGYKLTGLGAGTANGDSARYEQVTSAVAITGGTINGATIGASTASTGAFTTLSASGAVTLSGGTANGVAYLNGSKVLTTGSALTFNGTSLNLTGDAGFLAGSPAYWYNPAGNAYSYIKLDSSNVMQVFNNAASATAFSIGGSEQMRLTSTGLGIGTSNPGSKLTVAGGDIQLNGGRSILLGDSTNTYFPYIKNSGSGSIAFSNPAGSAVNMLLDYSGNLGLGVTPSAWSGFKAFDIGSTGSVACLSTQQQIGMNYYWNGSNYIYKTTNAASYYNQNSGSHVWYTAPSGTAGNAISFTQAMTLDASGNLGIGTSSPATKLDVNGSVNLSSVGNLTWGGAYGAGIPTIAVPSAGCLGFYPNGSTSGERMRIDSSGNVGIGTSSPSGKLHVSWAFGSPQLYLERTGSSTGKYSIGTSSNALFISDEVAAAERMRIDSSGNLLVGKTSADYTTKGVWINTYGIVNSATDNSSDFWNSYNTVAGAYRFYVSKGGTVFATSTTISAISDRRFKENVSDLNVGLAEVLALKPRKFDWKAGKGKDIKNDRGFIAQEFEQVFPDLIDEWKDPAPEGEEPYKSVRQDLIPVLVKAIQELNAKVESLEAQLKGA